MPSTDNRRRVPLLSDAEEAELQARMAADPDAREMTDEEIAGMRPASEVLPPALFAALTKRGRPKSPNKRVQVTMRVDPDVLAAYQATGPGWHGRMHDVLARGAKQMATADANSMSGDETLTPSRKGPRSGSTRDILKDEEARTNKRRA
ncbi:BrnA antitoxin family protein [Methylobacterium sp. ID0610]|uniref:BrnA antitoxin family protein n=1 Tax=Methylobacterium carpenticola TaxID=3344827 RepID=UPI00367FCB52